ncbi:hypothetical protein J9332_43235, partial [Aquimarina celericrescens]|nr:hypothetical protein [Aquimarina celericrescens]
GFFPSAAVGWVVSREKFFKNNVGLFNFLKFRYSYGEVGDDNIRINNQEQRFLYASPYGTRAGGSSQFFYGNPLINYGPLYLEGR